MGASPAPLLAAEFTSMIDHYNPEVLHMSGPDPRLLLRERIQSAAEPRQPRRANHTLYLDTANYRRLRSHCADLGITPSALVDQLLAWYLSAGAEVPAGAAGADAVDAPTTPDPPDQPGPDPHPRTRRQRR